MEKKWIYVGIGVVVVLAIAAVAAKMMMPGGWQQNADGTQTYTNSEGSVTTGAGASMPSTWPADAPDNYSGAVIAYSGNSNPQTGKAGAVVSYTVKGATSQAIVAYYRGTLAAKGWKIAGDATVGEQVILGATKDTRTFGVSIVDNKNGSISVTAGMQLQ